MHVRSQPRLPLATLQFYVHYCHHRVHLSASVGVHRGLSQAVATLDELNALHCFEEPEGDSTLLDLLWVDPFREDICNQLWKENTKRGFDNLFDYDALSYSFSLTAVMLVSRLC